MEEINKFKKGLKQHPLHGLAIMLLAIIIFVMAIGVTLSMERKVMVVTSYQDCVNQNGTIHGGSCQIGDKVFTHPGSSQLPVFR